MTQLAAHPAAAIDPHNADQERIARHLAEHVRRKLSGEAHRYQERVRPSRHLQLGILQPLAPVETPDDDGDGPAQGEVPRSADFNGAPPTMGLDFLVAPDGQGQAILEISVSFSVYVQRYPTREQQREHWKNVGEEEPPTEGGNKPEGGQAGAGDGGAAGAQDGSGSGAGKGAGNRPAQMSLYPIWERIDIELDPVTVPLDPSKPHDQHELTSRLQAAIDAKLQPIYAQRETTHAFEGNQRLPVTAIEGDDAHWWSEIAKAEGNARTARALRPHQATLTVQVRRGALGRLHVAVTLANESVAPRRGKRGQPDKELPRDMHLFNCKLVAGTPAGHVAPSEFERAPEDFRYDHLRQVWAHGRNAAADGYDEAGAAIEPDAGPPHTVRTTTWPIYRQRKLETNDDLKVTFADLADPETLLAQLTRVQAGMQEYLARWDAALATPEWQASPALTECTAARDAFAEEADRFNLGILALQQDPRLRRAYAMANEVFERIGKRKNITSWRLFQLVYQVIHMAALRARETDDPRFVSELDTADVLWFPTGGGKTEAYLGLIAAAMFYDRLRGKAVGVCALLRFPLRMLSVQQLVRVGRMVYVAEQMRATAVAGGDASLDGDPFRLGFYVGGDNTPNSLTGPVEWAKSSIKWWARELATSPDLAETERVITECLNPDCPGGTIKLEADVPGVRLRHVCTACGEMPVCHTDDEVFRYLPAVTVCTVDKLASVGRMSHVSHLIAGPALRCPQHGYVTHLQAKWSGGRPVSQDRCLAGGDCTVERKHYEAVTVHDPVPALQVQDEMHLLQEELGTFDAHYETLYEHLQRQVGTHKATKLLAATATVERYESQVTNLYARRARVFPAAGWTLEESFYTRLSNDARRLYVGAMPMLREAVEFGARVQALLHREVERLHDDPAGALERLELTTITSEADLQAELFLYDLSLGYVNRKRDGDDIANALGDYEALHGGDELRVAFLSGDSSLTEIADALREVEEQDATVSRPQRLRAYVGTSVVSHGVDIDRLNLFVMNWMPAKIADYIQASSRPGRTHVGLVIAGHDRLNLRDRSMFHYFLPHHRFLERLVAPVPVNRFAKFAIQRTLPGIVCAIVLQGYGRADREAGGSGTARDLFRRPEFQKWWNEATPQQRAHDLTERVLDALGMTRQLLRPDGTTEPIFDSGMVETMRHDVREELDALITYLKAPMADKLIEMLNPPPLTSFRDVDPSLEFSGMQQTNNAIDALVN